MLYSIDDIDGNFSLSYDICIIGSGPASFALARRLLSKRNLKIVVLEGNSRLKDQHSNLSSSYIGRKYNDCRSDSQFLYKGITSGWINKSKDFYPTTSRLRALGGTLNVWSGWYWPLTDHDISDWPINKEELKFYFKETQKIFKLGPYKYDDPGFWIKHFKKNEFEEISFGKHLFCTRILNFKREIFGRNYWERLLNRYKNFDLLFNANVLNFDNSSNKHLGAAIVGSIEKGRPGKQLKIFASRFVIAAGAIESTRIMLLSKIINNTNLGRYFMEHPYMWHAGSFQQQLVANPIKDFYFRKRPIPFKNNNHIIPTIVPKNDMLKKYDIGNFRVLLGGDNNIPGTFNVSWEQESIFNNSISLTNEVEPDIFGHQHVKITCNFTKKDQRTIKHVILSLSDVLEKNKLITKTVTPDMSLDIMDWTEPYRISPGNHPMGTTRMSLTSKDGVVDPNCKVHFINNLYIMSTSVFPSGGYANPTFTLLSLSIRLADHLLKTI